MPGKYKSLYQYLENRYANTVVLTFAQIEDLLGFTLPDSARVHQEWWANEGSVDVLPVVGVECGGHRAAPPLTISVGASPALAPRRDAMRERDVLRSSRLRGSDS